MTEREEEEVVITQSGRLVGCRGRVLVAPLVLAVLLLILMAVLVRSMLSGRAPQPVHRAATAEATLLASDQPERRNSRPASPARW